MLTPIRHNFARKIEILEKSGDAVILKSPIVLAGLNRKIVLRKVAGASFHGQIARDSQGNVDIVAEMGKHPDALWIRVKAIEAEIPNDNGDCFSRDEIKKSYRTFEGCPVFTNHENTKVENAKGKVVKAEWDEKEGAVYCTMFVDREANAPLCRAIEEGYITDVSMGTQVDFSTCSVCANKAYTAEDYCFVPGTPVLMSDLSVKNIEDVNVGDSVIDVNGTQVSVLNKFIRNVDEEIRSFTSRSIPGELSCTTNHKLFVLGDNGPELMHAGCISDDNTFIFPVTSKNDLSLFDSYGESEPKRIALCRLMGFYAAEGSQIFEKNGRLHGIAFSLGVDEIDTAITTEIIQSFSLLFGREPEICDRRDCGQNGVQLRFYDEPFSKFVTDHASNFAKNKHLSEAIVFLPEQYSRQFIGAYIDGDGHADKYGHIILSSASRSLASQIYGMLLRLGVSPNIGEYENSGSPTNRDKECTIYRTEISNAHARTLGFSKKCSKASKIVKNAGKLKNIFTEDKKHTKHKPSTINEYRYIGPVHTMETESGTYIAANTAVKNCKHVKGMKGRTLEGKKVYENNYGLKFIEISVVTDGACKDCTIREVLDPDEFVAKIASAVSTFRGALQKTATIDKNGGQAEIQKLNQAMDLLEDVSRSMLDQRQYIDLEFLSKVTDVLADLQHVNDELVDQGYGSIGQQQQPATAPPPSGNISAPEGAGASDAVMTGAEGIGKVTEPAAMAASSKNNIHVGSRIKDLQEKIEKIVAEANVANINTAEAKNSRGGVAAVDIKDKHRETTMKLAKIWENPSVKQYKMELGDGEFKIIVAGEEVWGLKGGEKVASLKKADLSDEVRAYYEKNPVACTTELLEELKASYNAGRIQKTAEVASNTKEQLEQTMEKQLETQKLPLHPRVKDKVEETFEGQLSKTKEGYDFHSRQEKKIETTMENQLNDSEKGYNYHKRQGTISSAEQTMELQLRNKDIQGNDNPSDRESSVEGVADQKEQPIGGQLNDWNKSDAGFKPTDETTEKQLRSQPEPWGRRISSKEDAKFALAAGTKAIIQAAISTGATPEEILALVSDFNASPMNAVAAVKAVECLASGKDKRQALYRRSKFHGASKTAGNAEVADFLLGALSDNGLGGEIGIKVLAGIASRKNAVAEIGEAIVAGVSSDEEENPYGLLASNDYLREVLASDEGSEDDTVIVNLKPSQVGADAKNQSAFASAAFAVATKKAAANGVTITSHIHVKTKNDGIVEVTMKGKKSASVETLVKTPVKTPVKPANLVDIVARKEARRKIVEAQMGGATPDMGMGGAGGAPGAPGGGGTTMPTPPPGGDPNAGGMPPASSLGAPPPGGEEEAGDEEKGEALPPGSICPVCGSDSVDLRGGEFDCKDCGAHGTFEVSVNVDTWPSTIEDTTPKKNGEEDGEEDGGVGDMAGGEGMEMPPMGLAASFKVTPEMIKIAGNKPIGSYCPHCGSSKVKLVAKAGCVKGNCQYCDGSYRVDCFVDTASNDMWAKLAWQDKGFARFASKTNVVAANKAKQKELVQALSKSGLTLKFARADATGKAKIIGHLIGKGLLRVAMGLDTSGFDHPASQMPPVQQPKPKANDSSRNLPAIKPQPRPRPQSNTNPDGTPVQPPLGKAPLELNNAPAVPGKLPISNTTPSGQINPALLQKMKSATPEQLQQFEQELDNGQVA